MGEMYIDVVKEVMEHSCNPLRFFMCSQLNTAELMSEQLAERLERETRRTATGAHTTEDQHDAEDKDLALAISLSLGSSADTVGAGEAAGTREEGRAEEGGREVPDPRLEEEDTRLHLDTKDLPEAAGVEDADAQADAGTSSKYSPPWQRAENG